MYIHCRAIFNVDKFCLPFSSIDVGIFIAFSYTVSMNFIDAINFGSLQFTGVEQVTKFELFLESHVICRVTCC